MKLPIRIVSTDFDGTFHTEREDPPVPLDLQALIGGLQSAGVVWVINTGRELGSLVKTLSDSRVSTRPDYVVTVERDIHVRNSSGYAPVEDWNTACHIAHERLFSRIASILPNVFAELRDRFSAQLFADAFSPLCMIAENNQEADAICAFLAEQFCAEPELTMVRNDIYGRLSHADFNKGSALGEICRQLGIQPDQAVAAGDHMNDLPMLNRDHARWLIAPANAVEAVKETVRSQDGYISEEPFGKGVASGLRFWLEHLGKGRGF